MIVGTLAVLIYVVVGGFLAVAITDFIQMIVLVVGMTIIAFFAADLAGGADKVLDMAQQEDLWNFLWPEPTFTDILFFVGRRDHDVRLDSAAGRVPARDVGQGRARPRAAGAVIGGASYILFAFVPMFIVACAVIVMGNEAMNSPRTTTSAAADLRDDEDAAGDADPVLRRAAVRHQEHFVGHAAGAVDQLCREHPQEPASGHERPPAAVRHARHHRRVCWLVLAYAIAMQGTSIYELVSSAYQVTLVGAFVPLVMGLYWKRATTQGAILSIGAGI
jgi:SSS family solute:Na+ symporter